MFDYSHRQALGGANVAIAKRRLFAHIIMTDLHTSPERRAIVASSFDEQETTRSPAGRDTSELFLDREALRYAAMRAGLEPGATAKVLDDWKAANDEKPPRKGIVQFELRGNRALAEGRFDGRHFHIAESGHKVALADVMRWRYVW